MFAKMERNITMPGVFPRFLHNTADIGSLQERF